MFKNQLFEIQRKKDLYERWLFHQNLTNMFNVQCTWYPINIDMNYVIILYSLWSSQNMVQECGLSFLYLQRRRF